VLENVVTHLGRPTELRIPIEQPELLYESVMNESVTIYSDKPIDVFKCLLDPCKV
jgi:hypothetical protein